MPSAEHETAELRNELLDLRLRVDALETRIAAAEAKHQSDVETLTEKWKGVESAMSSNTRAVANLADQQRASHYALVHLLAVTARQVRVPDSDLNEAMRIAKEAIPP